jgi:hypothetical protein
VKTTAPLIVPLLALAACSTGNDRTWVGNDFLNGGAMHLDAFTEPGRPEAAPGPAKSTLTSIDRSNWAPQVIVAPMDGLAATRTYAINYMWTDSTARQMGRMPSAVSSLELSEGSMTDQIWEAVASGPLAFIGGVMILPRMIAHSPTREVRYFPEQYWRAPAATPRVSSIEPAEAAPSEPEPQAPAAPAPVPVTPAK